MLGSTTDDSRPNSRHTVAMKIRPLTSKDVSETVALWYETLKGTYHFLASAQELTLDDAKRHFREAIEPGAALWVVVEGGEILGYLAQRGSYMDRLYVKMSAQRRGVGLALLRKAQELSPSGIELHTHQENVNARRFYEKHRFRAVKFGESPPPESAPDVEYHWRPE